MCSPFLVMIDEIWLYFNEKKGVCAENTLWHPLCPWLSEGAAPCEESGLQTRPEALSLLLHVAGVSPDLAKPAPHQLPSARAAEHGAKVQQLLLTFIFMFF